MQYNNNDQEFLDETHILDTWIEEEFGWELCNFCVIGNDELLIWISEDNKPTFNELEKISNFLNTKDIVIDPLCCNPCGYSVLECVDTDQDLEKFLNIQLLIKNWDFTKLREYEIRKRLELETTISESLFKTLSKEEYEKLPRPTKKQIQKVFEKIRNDWFFSQRKPNLTNYEYLEEENRRLKEENESLKRQINDGVNIEKGILLMTYNVNKNVNVPLINKIKQEVEKLKEYEICNDKINKLKEQYQVNKKGTFC